MLQYNIKVVTRYNMIHNVKRRHCTILYIRDRVSHSHLQRLSLCTQSVTIEQRLHSKL